MQITTDTTNVLPVDEPVHNKLQHLWHLVGNTPMVQIQYAYKGQKESCM